MASCQYLGKASGLVGSGGKYDSLPRTANGRPLGAKSDILSFSLVSKAWNTYSQPALYHTIHIRKSSQAKALAWTVGSSSVTPNIGLETSGRHIRYLTLSTLSYDRCDPSDVLVILSSSPHLVGFCDEGGIRCPLLDDCCDWKATPEKLLGVLVAASSFSFPEYPELDGSINTKYQPPLHLPSLTKLTLTLSDPILSKSPKGSTGYTYSTPPNTLLALLAEWDLPSLRILTMNTPYTLGYKLGDGFWRFFKSHGSRIVVLEFGRISAGTFICSASLSSSHDQDLTFNGLDAFDDAADAFDALEWDWTHPDWVAPHPLLPSHPNVRMIGIREIGERVRADWDEREEGVIWDQSELGSENGMGDHNNPFFMLYLQLSSLLLPSKVPFPSLKYIRDLDPDSDLLRRDASHSALLTLWSRVLFATRGGEVWLEDWRGWNLTKNNLERWKRC
ncbi:hypothetical protein C8J55DRAFT_419919 [Lentinula edodes]|uniref:F-box domain-containing protein n=1 Tax=Lentinula lateritia TaxID=40482 RepID=A0A9W9DZC5_9AGAR|nr:hypothetical protein C8J55DRAFT_419919 [Lentinula edodes]